MLIKCKACDVEFAARVRVEIWRNITHDTVVYGHATAQCVGCKATNHLGDGDDVLDLADRVGLGDFGVPCAGCGKSITALVAVQTHRSDNVVIACGCCYRPLNHLNHKSERKDQANAQ